MPTELRHLLFRPDEVIEAVGAYRRRLGEGMPEGPVLYSALESDDGRGPASIPPASAPECR